ncbi:MAG: family 10 glycosylhydrolase [Cyclonatronaceae bacterium]
MKYNQLIFLFVVLTVLLMTGLTSCSPDRAPVAGETYTAEPEALPETPRELRAVWIATVSNIDWPSERGIPVHQQKAELRAMFDRIAMLNMNTVIFQVRTATDALYASELEPWSEYLTGEQGKAPEPFYDPLAFAIEEAHKRGLELHAWINPFRSRHPSARSELADNHLSKRHPELVVEYGRHLWMDPGHPESSEWSLNVVRDIIRRYDVDAIHVDDYFYPYRERDADDNLIDFPDSASYAAYVAEHGHMDRGDWRRQNVDTFMKRLHEVIKEEDPVVRFGVSPIGLWRPDHQGDDIQGFDAYEQIYADARKWFRNGWLDYFAPQLYWPMEQEGQKYQVLVDWWHEQNLEDRHFWPGNFTNRVGYGSETWPVSEITGQIELTRASEAATGNIHFSMRVLMRNPDNLVDSLMYLYREPALVPATTWISDQPPEKPKISVNWFLDEPHLELYPGSEAAPWLYTVKTRYGEDWHTQLVPGWRQTALLDVARDGARLSAIAVTAVDRLGVESEPVALTVGPRSR